MTHEKAARKRIDNVVLYLKHNAAIVCLFLCQLLIGPNAVADFEPPNIVFVMADDLGYGHLGSYGQTKIRTPNLDRMAQQGMRFTQFYAGNCVCAPSRSVLLTGLHGGHTSVRANSGGVSLVDADVTFGELLQNAGYATGIFGKWGVGDHGSQGEPNSQGFDEFYGYLHQVHAHYYYPYFLWSNAQKHLLEGNENGGRKHYTHDVVMERAFDFIRRNRDERFLLYLPLTIPHVELLVPENSLREYAGTFPEIPMVSQNGHLHDQPQPRAAFAAMVTRMDADMGRLLSLLDKLGLDEKTLVIFTSDNGGTTGSLFDLFHPNGTLRGGKSTLYEGGLRVPMIARWPSQISAGTVNDHVGTFYDILATFSELAGTTRPQTTDGFSLVPTLLRHGQQPKHEWLYWEHPRKGLQQALRLGKWKVIRNRRSGSVELYDLESDVGEQENVSEQHNDIVQKAIAVMEREHVPPRSYDFDQPLYSLPALETGFVK